MKLTLVFMLMLHFLYSNAQTVYEETRYLHTKDKKGNPKIETYVTGEEIKLSDDETILVLGTSYYTRYSENFYVLNSAWDLHKNGDQTASVRIIHKDEETLILMLGISSEKTQTVVMKCTAISKKT